jgi:GTP-binding protein HflX
LVDTVGFVRDLPHELVAAFRSTLTETREATLLLHVIDASDPHEEDRRRQVEAVLADIGAAEVPRIEVYNKMDRAPAGFDTHWGEPETAKVSVSAVLGTGLPELKEAIRARLNGARVVGQLRLMPEQSRLRAKLFDWHAVRSEAVDEDGVCTLEVELTAPRWRELRETEGVTADRLRQKA